LWCAGWRWWSVVCGVVTWLCVVHISCQIFFYFLRIINVWTL